MPSTRRVAAVADAARRQGLVLLVLVLLVLPTGRLSLRARR
ncbi:hypothetical protein [Cellulomonas sp.]|nr:hypothetical protein [Cellulomonas sp.]